MTAEPGPRGQLLQASLPPVTSVPGADNKLIKNVAMLIQLEWRLIQISFLKEV